MLSTTPLHPELLDDEELELESLLEFSEGPLDMYSQDSEGSDMVGSLFVTVLKNF